MNYAAGILIINPSGEVLFLKRGPGGDFPGFWCFPGGGLEAGEDALTAAVRETKEETGHDIDPSLLQAWTRRISPPMGESGQEVDFITFVAKVPEIFIPDIATSGEHTAWQWAKMDAAPDPLHPGCRVSLARFDMDELGVARAMAAGDLTSPQVYGNVTLFDLRISGTGHALRDAQTDDDGKITREAELTFRRPEDYLTQEFCDRCNGLPVILLHPDERPILNGEEFSKRVIGMIFLPYIRGDEVRGIAKVYSEDAARTLTDNQLSTSPGVLLGNDDIHMRFDDGSKFLIEGKPKLVDHLAICPRGVWDKGKDPTGITTTGATDMKFTIKRLEGETDAGYAARVDEVNRHIEGSRNDNAGNNNDAFGKLLEGITGKLDTALGTIGKLETRMDAADEKARKDAEDDKDKDRKDATARCDAFKFPGRNDGEDDKAYCDRMDAAEKDLTELMEKAGEAKEVAADKAKKSRKDSETVKSQERVDSEDDKERKDSMKALTEANAAMEKRLTEMAALIPKPLTDADYTTFANYQARADAVCSMFGQSAGRPQQGETPDAYRVRLLNGLKAHSEWKDIDLNMARLDGAALELAWNSILTQAAVVARDPKLIKAGTMTEEYGKTGGGAPTTKFHGDPKTWMSPFMPNGAFAEFNTNTKH